MQHQFILYFLVLLVQCLTRGCNLDAVGFEAVRDLFDLIEVKNIVSLRCHEVVFPGTGVQAVVIDVHVGVGVHVQALGFQVLIVLLDSLLYPCVRIIITGR